MCTSEKKNRFWPGIFLPQKKDYFFNKKINDYFIRIIDDKTIDRKGMVDFLSLLSLRFFERSRVAVVPYGVGITDSGTRRSS